MNINRTFKTTGELLETIGKLPNDKTRASTGNSASHGWDLDCGFKNAVKYASEGWAEGLEAITRARKALGDIVKPKSTQQDFILREDGGSFIEVGAYCSGEPECFGDFTSPDRQTKPIRIIVNISASAFVSADSIRRRGAVIVAAIDVLEERGFMVEVLVCEAVTHGKDRRFGWRVLVKETGQNLDLDRLAFWLTHPAALRRLGFAVCELEDKRTREQFGFVIYGGYGIPAEVQLTDDDLAGDHIYFPSRGIGSYSSDDEALRIIRNLLIDKGFLLEADLEEKRI